MSPLASVAATVTTSVPSSLFSATLAVVGWPVNAGALLSGLLVAPVPLADQPLSPSSLLACTCTL